MTMSPWQNICVIDRVVPDRGVAVLVDDADGQQAMVALFRLSSVGADHPEEWFAIDHIDPVALAPVMARGLIGSVGTVPTVASPIGKERYDLRTGQPVNGDGPSLRTWSIRIVDDRVEVCASPATVRDNAMA